MMVEKTKTIGVSESTKKQLLWIRHEMEKEENKSLSYDKVIWRLIHDYYIPFKEGNKDYRPSTSGEEKE